MSTPQSGILAAPPRAARYLTFSMAGGLPDARLLRQTLRRLAGAIDGDSAVIGLGASVVGALGATIPGLAVFPPFSCAGLDVPSTPAPLWLWLRGGERYDLVHRALAFERLCAPAFQLSLCVDSFTTADSLDLSGYQDGIENPKGDAATAAAIVSDHGPGLDGASFVAVQQWRHDFARIAMLSAREQDLIVGRRKRDHVEIASAPASAHVKRTAQETFTPTAFLLRRSMPWSDGIGAGLQFVAFGRSFAAFEAQLRRMVGEEDGIVDALFAVSRPLTGSYFWCPPMRRRALDLSAVGLRTTR
jgi:putative iron-dependent peroxidase